jgi:hypothetical protein
MPKLKWRHAFVTLLVVASLLAQGTWALAGTTGRLAGTVVDQATGVPIAGAKVTVSAPSQTATAVTDASGRFIILSLGPDTYTVSVDKTGYAPVSVAGISIFADQSQNITLQLQQALKTIATVRSQAAGALVKSGTTQDIYSVNASTASAVQGLGGGGSLNSAYSAIASQPGVYVPQGQAGWAQSVYIRGANYTQLGYEFDGVPVQRSFDQYPANNLSALGQQEVQVYTGSTPVDAQSSAIGGFINQVVKTGTYPGFGDLQFGLGTPAFYHRVEGEAGGSNPNRTFSYYGGVAGYNQQFRFFSQYNGADLDQIYGSPYNFVASGCGTSSATVGCYANAAGYFGAFPIGPSGTAFGPFYYGFEGSEIADREAVANFHFAIPHHNDSGRDDVQLLYDVSFLKTTFPEAMSDWNYAIPDVTNGSATIAGTTFPNCGPNGIGSYTGTPCAILPGLTQNWFDTEVYNGPLGTSLTGANLGSVAPYFQPGSPTNRPFGAQAPLQNRDFYSNNSSIWKLQYQKNFGSSAYARVYAYTFYSDWLQQALSGATLSNFIVGSVSPDYGVITHTTGIVGQLAAQLSQHLLTLSGGYTRASTIRWNDNWYLASPTVALAVDSTNPTNGICYGVSGGVSTPLPCTAKGVSQYILPGLTPGTNTVPPLTTSHATDPTVNTIGSFTCGAGPCQYYTVGAGYRGAYNTVEPQFVNAAFEDTWRPNDRLVLNAGVHWDEFKYLLSDTTMGPSFLGLGPQTGPRLLYQNSFLNWYCFNTAQGLHVTPNGTPHSCPTGQAVTWTNASPPSNDYREWEPRAGLTYTIDPLNVIRASWGKYAQPASSAFQQYQNASNNVPLTSPVNLFYPSGYTSPAHQIFPEESFNSDLSWEHQIKNTDVSWKLTPFYRTTRNEIFNVVLDPRTNFVSGLNVGKKQVYGTELAVQKGNFSRNGFSTIFSFTYTWGNVKFSPLPNGTTVVTPVNSAIAQYNAYTSKCAPFQATPNVTSGVPANCLTQPVPGTPSSVALPTNGMPAAPCYTTAGAPDPACAAGSLANPYWNAPAQGLYNPNDQVIPYNQLPGTGVSSVASSYIIPYVTTLVLNYRQNKWAVTPLFQFEAGGRYGSPVASQGIDPASNCGVLAGSVSGDPRYPYGAPAGAPYDAQFCTASLTTPDRFTGTFDNFGQFVEPSQLTGSLQLSYDVSPKVTLQVLGTNLLNMCFGGTKEPWITNVHTGCWYTTPGAYIGNFFNPGNSLQPAYAFPYAPSLTTVFQQTYGAQTNPANVYFSAIIKF